jgi:hypothetical protein
MKPKTPHRPRLLNCVDFARQRVYYRKAGQTPRESWRKVSKNTSTGGEMLYVCPTRVSRSSGEKKGQPRSCLSSRQPVHHRRCEKKHSKDRLKTRGLSTGCQRKAKKAGPQQRMPEPSLPLVETVSSIARQTRPDRKVLFQLEAVCIQSADFPWRGNNFLRKGVEFRLTWAPERGRLLTNQGKYFVSALKAVCNQTKPAFFREVRS